MGIRIYQEPKLRKPDLVACWPGIGNIGVIATDTLRGQIQAEELAEIEPWDFFYPKKVTIKAGVVEDLEFPGSKFFYKSLAEKDLMLFVGEEQPTIGDRMYAEGKKAYQMANMVLDVAEKFGCRRVYTSGAAVSLTHHAMKPGVWAVASSEDLFEEIRRYENTILMGEVEGAGERGNITGLNGLLLGMAKKRGLEAICLMGEIPDYLSRAPLLYPRASKSILEVLSRLLGVEVDYKSLDEMTVQMDDVIDNLYQRFPQEVRDRIEQRKVDVQPRLEPITQEDEEWIKDHIDDLFKKKGGGDERLA